LRPKGDTRRHHRRHHRRPCSWNLSCNTASKDFKFVVNVNFSKRMSLEYMRANKLGSRGRVCSEDGYKRFSSLVKNSIQFYPKHLCSEPPSQLIIMPVRHFDSLFFFAASSFSSLHSALRVPLVQLLSLRPPSSPAVLILPRCLLLQPTVIQHTHPHHLSLLRRLAVLG
jgi:hypothetical protein